jgi:type II secretory pathway pseudopilin PulG
MINTGGFRDKARDAQRIADLKQVQTALELYFSDFRQYPDSGSGAWIRVTGSDNMSTALAPIYINTIPLDSEATGTDSDACNNPENSRYNYRSDGNDYILTAIMSVDTSNDESTCDALNTWGSACSGGYPTQDFCYGVENP